MNLNVILLAFIGTVLSDDTCTYINQNKNLVSHSVTTVSQPTSPGLTEEVTIKVGESITISCTDTDNTAFEYGEKTIYKCEEASYTKFNLPLCVAKCTTLVNLDPSKNSVFELADGTPVTDQPLPKSTPVTIRCSEPYAQMFQQLVTQACEAWDSAALCKKMCTVSSFDPADTQLSGIGILPDLTNPKYLKVGFSVSISCKSTDFDQPLGALDTHTCEEGHADKEIVIENCFKMCRVPTAPADTEYHFTQDQLRQGQTFTVKCTGDRKFPIDQTETTVVCRSDGSFPTPYPTCEATCKISAIDDSTTKLSKPDLIGGLAQKETVEVSCVNDKLLLPFGYQTPWTITCGPDNLSIDVPVCQKTCDVPEASAAPNAQLSSIDNARMRLREPITATCNDYYSYQIPAGISKTKEFLCSDAGGSAVVTIDEFCYVYAKLSHAGNGRAKVQLTGEINDGHDYSTDTDKTVVDFEITGKTIGAARTATAKPNEAVVVDVGTYEPLQVVVKTTSEVGGSSRLITITEQNIYPGPESPTVVQLDSTSSTVDINLAHPSNDVLNAIIQDYLIKYTIQYEDKDGVETIIVTKDDRNKVKILSNLMPASNYTLNTTTVLPAEYGGMGDTTSSKVYTGPSQVAEATLKSTVVEDVVTVEWAAVDDANKYEVAFIEDGISTGTQLPTEPTIKKTSMKGEIQYELRIKAIREIDINNNGNPVQFFGDVLKINLPGPPAAPEKALFQVTNTSDSVTVSRVSSDDPSTRTTISQNDGIEYIVFYSQKGKTAKRTLAANENEVIIEDLSPSTTYDIDIAQAVGPGYGMRAFLTSIKTADCRSMQCINCQESTQFTYVLKDETVTVRCLKDNFIERKDPETGESRYEEETTLLCNGLNQYVYQDATTQIVTNIECTKKEAVIVTVADYTLYYIIAGVGVFLVIMLVIIIVVIRRRRTQGSYNAKKAKETSKNGVASPDMTMEPKTFVNDEAFFENKWDNELLRAQSGRSKATSYGSQELRMTIADSDSGITEDLENTYFNPALYSTNVEDDTISTKSALV